MDQDRVPPKRSDSAGPGKRLAGSSSAEKPSTGGKRLQKDQLPQKKGLPGAAKAAIALLATVAVLFAGYTGLCAWVGAKIPEGTTVELQPGGQTLSLGGLSTTQAKELLAQSMQVDESLSLTVTCAGQQDVVSAQVLAPDPDALLQTLASAEDLAISRPFLTRGLGFLLDRTSAAKPTQLRLDCTYRFSEEGEAQVDALLDKLGKAAETSPTEPAYTLGEDTVEAVCGTPGTHLDVDAAKAAILDAFQQGQKSVTLSLEAIDPPVLDAAAINQEILVEPEPIKIGKDGKVTPAVVGVSIDVDAAQAALNAAAPGQTVSIPLVYSQPDYALADSQGLLYKDMLSECKTYVGGSANRVYNVSLAASYCNGTVLMPGDVFSYHAAVGNCTAAEGYREDLGFMNGKTVDMLGGGVCQMSSSLYYCTLYANLEVVERRNHAFTVDYLPAGLDATFYSSSPDYRFRNNTDFPVKITAQVENRNLIVRFYGTNPEGTYVTTERSQVAFVPFTTVYTPDPEIPIGTTKVDITPYNGMTIVVYRCVYAADGTLISRTYEDTSKYAARNRVILYNPADAANLGLELPPDYQYPSTPEDPTVVPPVETPPVVTTPPVETTPPAETTPPVETVPPAETDPPVESPPAETPTETLPAEQSPSQDPPPETEPVPFD